jgi:putative ABC transport system substrate-binding protein
MLLIPSAIAVATQHAPAIPIVCAAWGDPVAEGFAASLARPGGNVTGPSWETGELSSKRLELAAELVPGLKRVAVI